MAEELVIRIEDLEHEKNAPAIPRPEEAPQPSWFQSVLDALNPQAAKKDADDAKEATSKLYNDIDGLFDQKPWWLESEFLRPETNISPLNDYVGTPKDSDKEDCPCADILNAILGVLEDIYARLGNLRGQNRDAPDPSVAQAQQAANIFQQSINQLITAVNVSQIVNNPVNATANIVGAIGNIFANVSGTLVGTIITGLLGPLLGPLAPIVGTMIGGMVGTAVSQFFNALSDGLVGFFDYVQRQVDELAMFSPEIAMATTERQMRMMNFQFGAARSSGEEFANIYSAQTDLLMEVEKIKLALFNELGGPVDEIIGLLADLLGVWRTYQIDIGLAGLMDVLTAIRDSTAGGLIGGAFQAALAPILNEARKVREKREAEEKLAEAVAQQQIVRFWGWNP